MSLTTNTYICVSVIQLLVISTQLIANLMHTGNFDTLQPLVTQLFSNRLCKSQLFYLLLCDID